MKRFCAAILLLIIGQLSYAGNGESSRVLVHTLNYLSQDYAGAVKDGKIISQSEFKEMNEFGETAIQELKELAPTWTATDSAIISGMIYQLDS